TKGVRRRTQLEPPLVFLPGDEPLQLRRRYRGTIQVDRVGRRLRAINVVGLEQYLYGVVPAEVPDHWPAEVLKAQAVAARSYALATRSTTGAFDLFPDVRSQVYLGIDEEEESTNEAVDATAGQILVHGGRVVTTYFHSTSGGRTASVVDVWPGSRPVPYLVSVDDPYDSISPHHTWGPVVVPAARLERVLRTPGRLVDVRTMVNPSARVDRVVGFGTQGEAAVKGGDLRRELGLRSTWFRIGVLALAQPARPHVWGGTSRLAGIARDLPGAQLEQSVPGGWRAVAPLRPRPDGAFSVAVRPSATSSYRVTASGARTPAIQLLVAPQVRLAAVTDPMELRGTVRPAVAGAAVEIQRQAGAAWRTVGRGIVSASGQFTVQMHVPPGSYRARVARPGRGLAAGTSATLVVTG
ncbi:MAG: SpoIID/LytB domain-containing protein, partial [Actinomycetota bacterium]|nr:SpoIID/LytB domain-containing protein [Actinomycetota bacterium]